MSGATTLLVEPDPTTAAFMRHMLTRAGYEVILVHHGKDGLIAAWRDFPDFIVLELDLPDVEGIEVVRRLRQDTRTSRTPIVALTKHSLPEDVQESLSAGVDQFIVKQQDAVDILLRYLAQHRRLRLPAGEGTAPIRPGRLIAFMGAKGGVGSSSLCLNVAHEIHRRDASLAVAVADMVLPMGGLGTITGSEAEPSFPAVTQLPREKLTSDYLRTKLPLLDAWGFRLLPGSPDPRRAKEVQAERIGPLLQAMRSAFQVVLLDVGDNVSRLAMLALSQADIIVLVLTPSPLTAATARTLYGFLQSQGVPASRIFPLSNRPYGVEDLTTEGLEAELEASIEANVPHMGPNLYLCSRIHAPLMARFPEELGTLAIEEVAGVLAERLESEAARVSRS